LPFEIAMRFTIEKKNQTFFLSKPLLIFNTPKLSRKPLEYIRSLIGALHGKNGFAEGSKILAGYRKVTFVEQSK